LPPSRRVTTAAEAAPKSKIAENPKVFGVCPRDFQLFMTDWKTPFALLVAFGGVYDTNAHQPHNLLR
jgi:hypothetical protein